VVNLSPSNIPNAGKFDPTNLVQLDVIISSHVSPPIQGVKLVALVGEQSAQPSLQLPRGRGVSLQPQDICYIIKCLY
jgi:hypothetical protein